MRQELPYPIGNGPMMDPRPPLSPREKWFAWKPVYAGASPDGQRAKGWVWLKDVEVIVKPVPGDDRAGSTGGVYRKLSKGRVDSFGLRKAHDFADDWLVNDCRFGLRDGCDCHEPLLPGERIEPRIVPKQPPLRGEADQFGGPRIIVDRRDRYYMPEGGD